MWISLFSVKIIFNCVQIVWWITKIFSLLDLECVEEVIKVNFVSFFTSNLLWTFTQAGCLQTLDVVGGEKWHIWHLTTNSPTLTQRTHPTTSLLIRPGPKLNWSNPITMVTGLCTTSVCPLHVSHPRYFTPWTYSKFPAYSVKTRAPSFRCL